MNNLVLTWLSYYTTENGERRHDQWHKSFKSIQFLARLGLEIDLVLIDNAEKDNDFLKFERDKNLPNVPIFKAANEFCDVAAHYVGLHYADEKNCSFFCYFYDDFVLNNPTKLLHTQSFLEHNPDVACCRVTRFEATSQFNAEITSKERNPEAVRFSNTFRGEPFYTSPSVVKYSTFYKCNFRPISRPTVWSVPWFKHVIGEPNPCPTLQEFEKHMYECCDAQSSWTSAFLDSGMCYTFPQNTSERIYKKLDTKPAPKANLTDLKSALKDSSRWI